MSCFCAMKMLVSMVNSAVIFMSVLWTCSSLSFQLLNLYVTINLCCKCLSKRSLQNHQESLHNFFCVWIGWTDTYVHLLGKQLVKMLCKKWNNHSFSSWISLKEEASVYLNHTTAFMPRTTTFVLSLWTCSEQSARASSRLQGGNSPHSTTALWTDGCKGSRASCD